MKTCTKCGESKPLDFFWKDKRRPNGRMSACAACKGIAAKTWAKNKPGYNADRYLKIKESERERHLVRKYGVSLADYSRMLKDQGGMCAVCGKKQGRSFDVDHCHSTGIVRGLLCTNCNRLIGHAADDPDRLRKAADYLDASLSRKSQRNSSEPQCENPVDKK